MGSLGSSSVNEVVVAMLKKMDDSFNIIYATGKRLYEDVLKENLEKENIKIFERVDGIRLMKQADLLVSRAGATTIAEITAIQIPTILIPSPFVPNNHQYYNALALTSIDGAKMIEEKDLNEQVLFDNIKKLIVDEKRLKMMKEKLKQLANPNVLNDIVDEVEKIC
jgi:UDP-N-acetylglucosamine:LPS N-acetylglucosamine transferase